MPKLNVQQTNQNVIQAFKNALAIGNLKGIIASDGSHNFSTAGSNRNLLDNPWFTVRQRGDGPFVAQISADRWYAAGGGLQVTLGDGGATLAFSATYREFRQTIANPTYYANGTYTMSIKVTGYTSSGSIRMQVHDGANASVALFTFNSPGIHTYTFTTGANGIGKLGLYNIANTDATMTVEAIKLERGSVSTLANDVPPDYGEELLKCLRYQWVLDTEVVYGVVGDATITTQNTGAMMVLQYPVPMNRVPTLSVSGAFRSVGGSGSAIQVGVVTSMEITTNASNKTFARITITGTNMGNTGTSAVIGADGAGAKLIFDANI